VCGVSAMHTILVPVDGSDHSLKALHIACDLGEKYGGKIALLHILTPSRTASDVQKLAIAGQFDSRTRAELKSLAAGDPGPIPAETCRTIGRTILEDAAGRVHRRGLEVDVLDMETGDPAEAIILAQRRIGASTIAMGCRGEANSARSVFGSVSNRVFERADCTCLSVK